MIHLGNIVLYVMGWGLFVAMQAQNSIRSSSNGLDGVEGWKSWMRFHLIDLMVRGFFSGLFYGFIVHTATLKLQAAGFPVTSYMIAGFGGWSANGLVYQICGVLGIRVEMGEKVPPANAQVVPQSASTTNPNSGAK